MDERAAIPVTLPRENPTASYWQDPPDPELADYLSADTLPATADTVVIGSGITGSSAAWNLLTQSPGSNVLMLEARQTCSGATGRNGGHTKAASYRSFLTHASTLNLPTAIQIARLEYENIKATHAFAQTHNIDCDLYTGDTVDIIYCQKLWDAGIKAIEAMRKAMPDELETVARYHIWTKEEARENFFVKGEDFCGAFSYQAGSLSAYKFVIGILKMALKMGLQLFTNSPSTKVEKDTDGLWSVETERGTVKAKRVVLATNGYTAFLRKEFQGLIVPLRGQIQAHRPGKNMPAEGLPTTYSFIYENGYEYMIPRPRGSKFAGDIIIGGGLIKNKTKGVEEYGRTDDGYINEEISKYLLETTLGYFGENWGEDDDEGRVRKQWTGIMGDSVDGFPFVGEVPGEKGLWMAASFQGHGMALCFLSAKALISMMGEGEEKREIERWFPKCFRASRERLGKRFVGRH